MFGYVLLVILVTAGVTLAESFLIAFVAGLLGIGVSFKVIFFVFASIKRAPAITSPFRNGVDPDPTTCLPPIALAIRFSCIELLALVLSFNLYLCLHV